MGAWDTGIFDDDTAYDVLTSLALAAPLEQMVEWFAAVQDDDYLEYTDGQCVLVSAAVIDAALNGTAYRCDDPDTLNEVVEKVKGLDPSDLRPVAVRNLHRLLGEGSELQELWAENEELYPVWRQGVEELIDRLD